MAHFRKGTPRGAERRALKAERAKVKKAKRAAENRHQGSPVDPTEGMVERFPSAFPSAPPAYDGIARTLSRGLVDE
jgi:hypothetical protein